MEKTKKLTTKKLILILVAIFVVSGCALGGVLLAKDRVKKVSTDEEFTYVNPDETKAEADEGFTIDGVLDEEQYQNNNWLYLHNTDAKADVDVSMTTHFGEKGMYIVYDVTERNPVYVNLDRASTVNSCIEMYLAPNSVTSKQSSYFFEIDLLPTGHMSFKKTDGKGAFIDVTTSNDIMAYLGATTKGGEVNTKECTGYCLELFIPWEYTEQFGINSEEMKDSYIYVTPAHITSFNYEGKNSQEDRYWYFFGDQHGASMDLVYQYFRFNDKGVIGTTSTSLVEGDHYSITGDPAVIPGMKTTYTITPEEGYTINSVLVNGEEHIKNVSYSEEGAVLLTVRGKTEGLEIKATAEAVKEGNKTLSGQVKIEAGSLSGVSVSYKGSNGKKPIEIDRNGKFVLTDLQPGYYKITVEKEGYDKLERGIYLNRDITTELKLAAFYVSSGKVWGVDYQEDGILHRFGGTGVVLSRASYDKFSVALNMKFDEELTKEYDHTYFTQQRQGIQIKFSNDRYWHVDILYEQGGFKVQYAKIMGDKSIYDTWKGVYILSEEEVALYKGKNGLTLEVRRDGKYGNVYLNDKLIAVEQFDDEFEKCTAQIGFEAWAANRVVAKCAYKIKTGVNNVTKHTLFNASAGWDISGQYDGYLSLPQGGSSRINFASKYVNMDLTLKVRDYQNDTDAEGKKARTDVLFVFENGAHQSFGVTSSKTGKIEVQSVKQDDGKQIYDGFKVWDKYQTDEETALYKGDGIDFRIVRNGTKVYLYLGDRQLVNVADLTSKNSGVTADMPATVYIRHYDDKGVEVIIPFKLKTELDTVAIESVEGENGKVVPDRNDHLIGDEVTISGKGKEGYYCVSMKVNGEPVQMNYDGTYKFRATEKTYTLDGEFAKQVFAYDNKWNLLKQNEGVITVPEGGNRRVQLYKQYANVDLTLKGYDNPAVSTLGRIDVLFNFENGKHISFGFQKRSDGSGKIAIQSQNNDGADNAGTIYTKWSDWGELNAAETALYKGDGIDFRIVRDGTNIYLYLGTRRVNIVDLTYNNSGVTPDMKATIYIRHYEDKGVEYVLPFTITEEVISQGIFTTGELAPIGTSYNVSAEQTTAGVKVTYSDSASKWARVGVNKTDKYTIDENGVHIEITDIEYAAGDYAFAMHFGNYTDVFFNRRGYVLIYENSGQFSIVATKADGVAPENHKIVLDGKQLDPLTGNLTIDIKLVEGNYVIIVNGNSFTIPAVHSDGSYNIQATSWAQFSFAFVDTSRAAASFPGATYTIKSILSSISGVTLDSTSKTIMIDQTIQLKASVYPEKVLNSAVRWTSSDESIAKVDQYGNVVAISEGTVSITATSVGDTTKKAVCQVTVNHSANTDMLTASGSGITMANTATGVKVVTTKDARWTRVYTKNKYSMEDGLHIEIGNITAVDEDENYSIVVAIGTNNNQWYDKTGYLLICGQKGDVAIVKAPISGTDPISVDVIDSVNIGQLGDSLSISIMKKDTGYVITVNGKELTIENGADVLSQDCCVSFGVLSDITIENGEATGLYVINTKPSAYGREGDVSFVIESILTTSQKESISVPFVIKRILAMFKKNS